MYEEMGPEELVHLLKHFRRLLRYYLELTNENFQLYALLLRLRSLLSHDHVDLRQFLSLSDQDREALGIAQEYYQPYETLVKQLDHELSRLEKVLAQQAHEVELHRETLLSYQAGLEEAQEQAELVIQGEIQAEAFEKQRELREVREHALYEGFIWTHRQIQEIRREINSALELVKKLNEKLIEKTLQEERLSENLEVTVLIQEAFHYIATELAGLDNFLQSQRVKDFRAEYEKSRRHAQERRHLLEEDFSKAPLIGAPQYNTSTGGQVTGRGEHEGS